MAKAKKKGSRKTPKTEIERLRRFRVTPSRIRKIYRERRDVGKAETKVLSYGGGVDSFSMLLAAMHRGEPPSDVVFSDVTDPRSVLRLLQGREPVRELGESPGEWPGTYRHLVEVAIPFMERHGIPFHWLTTEAPPRRWPWRKYARTFPILGGRRLFGEERQYSSLIHYFEDAEMMFTTTNVGGRVCTNAAKVRRISRWVRQAFPPGHELEMWIGFDADEMRRIQQEVTYTKTSTELPGRILRYPLIEWDICRCRGVQLIRESGFPVPRKSACSFCGLQTRRDWRTLAVQQPETFERAAQVERHFKGTSSGKMLFFSGEATTRRGRGQAHNLAVHAMGWSERTRGVTKPTAIPCEVCEAAVKATKAASVGWLDEPTPEEMMEPRAEFRALVGLPPLPMGQMELAPIPPTDLPDMPTGVEEEQIIAELLSRLKEENPPTGPALHWLVIA